VTVAVLAKLAATGIVKPNERVVAFITGNGLKTLDAVAADCQPTVTVAPNLEAFQAAINLADLQ
jgi:threonine synthase